MRVQEESHFVEDDAQGNDIERGGGDDPIEEPGASEPKRRTRDGFGLFSTPRSFFRSHRVLALIISESVVMGIVLAIVLPLVLRDDGTPLDCNPSGVSRFPFMGQDNSQRLLLREGVIDQIPPSLCGNGNKNGTAKNVILVIGDGMGWEMIRAGAIGKQVVDELESLGCDTKTGCTDDVAAAAKAAFAGRTTADYYTEGRGSGLSFQELEGFTLITSTAIIAQKPSPGFRYAPYQSLLEGNVSGHESGQAPLATNKCGFPIDFSPFDFEAEGGNMVLWDEVKGGEFPWDERYYQDNPDTTTGFDPEYIMRHAPDSASTASTMATGHRAGNRMFSETLYEEHVSTLLEDAMYCGKAGGVVSSVPILDATAGAFIAHTNNRLNRNSTRRSFELVNPSFASGVCGEEKYPYAVYLDQMREGGALSSNWTLLEQDNVTLAENFYDGISELDPDIGDHIIVCLGGDYTVNKTKNLPYRGIDSTWSNRWNSSGEAIIDPETNLTIGVNLTTPSELRNHYKQEEIKHIPHISANVQAALDFLGKDDDGFFLMYEQGDIDLAAHDNHMDDMLGTMLDINDGVRVIMDWINANGGYEKNTLYVTSDHDLYLTLNDDFPEKLAMLLIDGESHNITPQRNSAVGPWRAGIMGNRTEDDSKTVTEHIRDYTTWKKEDIVNVGHFWGARGSGGNGWAAHSTRPVPLYYEGDDGCIEALISKGFQVVGRQVKGRLGKVDQVHLHACMLKNLFGLSYPGTAAPTSAPTTAPTTAPTVR